MRAIVLLNVYVPKGTYIRALGRDLGEAMNCFGHIYELRRTHIGNFSNKCAIYWIYPKN